MPSEEKKWQRRSDERPQELAEAAFAMFAERGFAATRLEDVAKSAGVSKATIYRYFDNKEQLFEAVVRQKVSPQFAQMSAFVEAFEGTTTDLLKTFFSLLRGALDGPFPSMVKLIISESENFPALSRLWSELAVKRMFKLVAQILKRGVDRGEFRELDPQVITPLIMAPVLLLGVWKRAMAPYTDLRLDPVATLEAHVQILIRGLAADPPQGEKP